MCSGMLIQFGNLKGSWLSNQFTKLLMTKCLEALPVRIPHAFAEENKSFSVCICPGVYVNAFLIFLFGDTHICYTGLQNIPKFHLEADIIHLQNRSLLLKMWACLYFSALFPFRGSRCTFYICLVFGDVIFDELWVVTDIDIRVSTVYGPVFDEAEVNPASLLT